jgi:hypothetical protein
VAPLALISVMRHLESFRNFGRIARKWRDFTERRRLAYTQLYDSGDWKIHYNQTDFQQRLREVAATAKRMEELAIAVMSEDTPSAAAKPQVPPQVPPQSPPQGPRQFLPQSPPRQRPAA